MPTTKHLRLSIDFHITIADTPPLLPEGTIEPPDPDYDSRQARLLEAVKNHPDVLMRWMRDLVASTMFGHSAYGWFDRLNGGELALQAILAPVLHTLPVEDQEYFDEVTRYEVFDECTDMFQKSFTIQEEPPVLAEFLTTEEQAEIRRLNEEVRHEPPHE